METNPILGSFEDTFGENRGNDTLFFLEDVAPKKQQEENIIMTVEKVRNELDLLSCETLDADSIEKNLMRVIDWFESNQIEQELLSELPDKLGALFENMKDQVHELDGNATGQLRRALNKMAEVDLLKDHLENFEREHGLKGKIGARRKEIDEKMRDKRQKIKKIQKQKDLKKRKKLYDAENKNKLKITKRERNGQKGEAPRPKKK